MNKPGGYLLIGLLGLFSALFVSGCIGGDQSGGGGAVATQDLAQQAVTVVDMAHGGSHDMAEHNFDGGGMGNGTLGASCTPGAANSCNAGLQCPAGIYDSTGPRCTYSCNPASPNPLCPDGCNPKMFCRLPQ